eukprot:GDKI01033665.1.p1 GENE.GDKI01033665.1~~GDKI01033665.1.p1  ORF type:complete len:154 (-),score=70.99 GDKI01033665.1:366-827(-)
MSEWDGYCQQWLVDTQWCQAGGLANAADGNLYAAYPADLMWQAQHQQQIPTDVEDVYQTVDIDEPTTLYQVINGETPPYGLWLAGEKYTVVVRDEEDSIKCIFCAKKKGGVHIAITPAGSAVLATYSEDLEQTSGNAKSCAIAFAKYLTENGY